MAMTKGDKANLIYKPDSLFLEQTAFCNCFFKTLETQHSEAFRKKFSLLRMHPALSRKLAL